MRTALAVLPGLLALCLAQQGQSASLVTVSETGSGNINGVAISYSLSQDPGPGGLPSALTYNLPFAGVVGDVELIEPQTGIPGDVLRFNGNGTLVYYSMGTAPNTPDLADQPRPPFPVPNTVQIPESASGDAFYTPTAGQPGFDASATPTYHFVETPAAAVPEPSSYALLFMGGAGLLAAKFRRKRS